MKTTLIKISIAICVLFIVTSLTTTFSIAKISHTDFEKVFSNSITAEDTDCWFWGTVFVGKTTVFSECLCGLEFKHFNAYCDTRYYDACRLVMCGGNPCCNTIFPPQ